MNNSRQFLDFANCLITQKVEKDEGEGHKFEGRESESWDWIALIS